MKKVFSILGLFILFAANLYPQSVTYDIQHYLDGVTVFDINSDGENIWFATNGKGIYQYSLSKNKWYNYSTNNKKLKLDFFYCIAANKDYVWAGSTDGLYIYNKKRRRWIRRKFGKGGQLGNWIRSISFDKYSNSVWIGRFQYLTRYNLATRRFTDFDLTVNGNDKSNTIKSIAVDGDSLLWIGTEAGVHKIYKYKVFHIDSTKKYYDNSLNYFNGEGDEVSVSSLLPEKEYIWFGTDEFITPQNPNFNVGGLFRFNRQDEWIKFDKADGLQGNGIFSLAQTGNYLWASVYHFNPQKKEAEGLGLSLLNKVLLSVKPVNDERIPNNVYKIFFDGTNIWLGTNEGTFKINLTNKLIPNFKDLNME